MKILQTTLTHEGKVAFGKGMCWRRPGVSFRYGKHQLNPNDKHLQVKTELKRFGISVKQLSSNRASGIHWQGPFKRLY